MVLILSGCYVAYKEAKHHELHKIRAEFESLHDKHKKLIEDVKERDPELLERFTGELIAIDEALDVIKNEDAGMDLIQEIEKDLEEIRGKIAKLFKN